MSLSESSENACVVCFKDVHIYSIGDCDHPVCYECSTRMRVLCRQNECPICRQDMPRVIFTSNVKPFRTVNTINYLQDKKFKICFESGDIQSAYNKLLEHVCALCSGRPAFRTFQYLKDHMRKEHELQYCDLCVENLMIFTGERRSYNRQELAQHRRKGDPDDRSHRGHPLCEFCDQRYMDNDELYRHLRRDHLFCHFCDADGFHHYYPSYDDLLHHFREEHYLCEEGACIEEKFTPVFRSEIDLKAHRASVHGRTLGKAAAKQNRTLEFEFTLAPRPRERPRIRRLEEEEEGAIGGDPDPGPNMFSGPRINTDCIAQFPSLSGAPVSAPARSQRSNGGVTIRASRQPLAVTDENFPALGPDALGGCKTVRLSVNRPDRPTASTTKTPTNVSIHVNHRPNGQSIRIRPSVAENFPSLSRSKASEDFPSLSRGKAPAPGPTQWAGQPKPVPKPQPKPPPRKQVDDYPALNSRFNSSCTVASSREGVPSPEEVYQASSRPKSGGSETVKAKETIVEPSKSKSKKKKSKGNTHVEGKTTKESVEMGKKKETSEISHVESTKKSMGDGNGKGVSNGGVDTGLSESPPTQEPRVNGVLERKRSELTIGNLENQEETSRSDDLAGNVDCMFKNVSNNFPPLGANRVNRPPPGFSVPVSIPKDTDFKGFRPPPGFSVTLNSVAMPQHNDLTFTSSSGQSYSILPTTRQYVQPPDFAHRNQNLITKVAKCLKESDFAVFRQLSANFRQGIVSAWTFYEKCRETMGLAFAEIFPEMLVLLPDIDKQQELHAVSDHPGRPGTFEVCATCNQVLSMADLRHHLTSHSLENHFPMLGQIEQPSCVWVKK